MKIIQKLILPVLIIAAVYIVYTFYFAPKEDLGSFTDFDPNNSAVKEIRVKLLIERGINKDMQNGASIFYVSDKLGTVVMVSAPLDLPEGIDSAKEILLRGHLNQNNSFHAHEVLLN